MDKFQNTIAQNNALGTIKKPGGKTEQISKEEYDYRVQELVKCKRDIVYFAEKYYKIINLDRGLETIKLYDVQKDALNAIKDNKRLIILSGRQQGKCGFSNCKILVRSKKTGEIKQISIGEFFKSCKYIV